MEIRPFSPADENFVLNSFMKSFVVPRLATIGRAPVICQFDADHVLNYWHDWMVGVLAKGQSLVFVDDGFFILGWAAIQDGELCYIYTRKLARGNGVARKLLEAAKIDPKTCPKRVVTDAFRKHFPE